MFRGDCLEQLAGMASGSVNCCVTSPPYYGLRDYGHDNQIGLEDTPEQYVNKMVDVFREVKRVLQDDGTLWLNLGDSYSQNRGGDTYSGFNQRYFGVGGAHSKQDNTLNGVRDRKNTSGLPPKNLLGIPWRVAFALQADGWYLRQDIIWHKPNPMPESVTDRCTKSHEYIFLMSKSKSYYYDQDAVREPHTWVESKPRPSGMERNGEKYRNSVYGGGGTGFSGHSGAYKADGTPLNHPKGRNKRSVWKVTTQPFTGAHFAVFPEKLIEPCILAGCPVGGTVLDPFCGSGTTAVVSLRNSRNAILCELNPDYIKIAEKRLTQIQVNLL